MSLRLAFPVAIILAATTCFASEPAMDSLSPQTAAAERLLAQGSFQKAHDAFAAIDASHLSSREQRWITFRLIDTDWRAAASTSQRDDTRLSEAQTKLTQLVNAPKRQEGHDLVWAEAEESLGDFYWERPDSRNWWQAWQSYQVALDWWAGANVDLELARRRYIAICWRIARPSGTDADYYYGYYGNQLPFEVLSNLLEIVRTDDDRAQAHYLMAMFLKDRGGDLEQIARVDEEFEAALKLGKRTTWYDDALYNYAYYLETYGRAQADAEGNVTRRPDYVRALALYRRFLSEFKKGESRWYDSAKSQAQQIVQPQLTVSVSNVFLPGSQLPYSLSWRNIPHLDLALYTVDLTRPALGKDDSSGEWLARLEVAKGKKVRSWTKEPKDHHDYQPGSSEETLEELPVGAYVLIAAGTSDDGKHIASRDLVLITRTAVVVKSAPSRTLLWVVDASTGEPRPEAKATLWTRHYRDSKSWWTHEDRATDASGLATFERHQSDDDSGELYAAATSRDDQAFSTAGSPSFRGYDDGWKITAFTDRPAYRPGEKAQWKILARVEDHDVYRTPADQKVRWEITDPQGSKTAEGTVTLNAFGSAWGELAFTDKMPLGEYRISFSTPGGSSIGGATLLRLEEYKLPEFTVSVKTPEENGHRKTFRVGEKVTAEVQVDYYFGGAVADADVQLLVYQSPYWAHWEPPREYPWFYGDMQRSSGYYGYGGSVIKQERLKTDATGKAQITFDTPRGANQDFEYRVEARVTDSSRREVSGSGTVRVTRQSFYAFLTPQHMLFAPHDHVVIDAKTIDANDEPQSEEGTITITRDRWWEVWLDPKGKEVSGAALNQLYREHPSFSAQGYVLKFQGYQHDAVETRTVKTNAQGEAEIAFSPDQDGYYHVMWSTPEKGHSPVRAETYVWVARPGSVDIGYRHGGLELLIDKDTVKPGATIPVMISVPTPERWVLFTVESDDLHRDEVLHLTGTVKLIQLKLEDAYVPNVFLQGTMVRDQQLFQDTKQIVVPPIKHYLNVSVEPDRKEYQARDQGHWVVTTKDDEGRPVAAEVSLGVVDESVYAIQSELAPDVRQFFFGTKRGQNVQVQTSFNQKSYALLKPEPPAANGTPAGMQPGSGALGAVGGMNLDDSSVAEEREAPPTSMAAPMAAPAPSAARAAGPMKSMKAGGKDSAPPPPPPAPSGGKGKGGEPAVVVRNDFRSTAFWSPSVVTDKQGHAKVSLSYPDSLTTWRATARAATAGSQFGIATGSAKTRMPLLVRLQGPRFFVVGDRPVISAVVNNNTDHVIEASVELTAQGLEADGHAGARSLKVPPHGEARADWTMQVEKAGEAKLKVTARGGGFGDAMEKSFPVYEHGIDKLIAKSGKLRGSAVTVALPIPHERREGSTELSVQVAPSLAVTMLDALPYLADYPYGCTEQTLSRFLPSVIVRKTLTDLGVDATQVMSHSFGGIEPSSADKTHPGGKKDLAKLDSMTQEGLKRLADFQHGDGGWGWWKIGESDRFMTAYVLWGLSLARDAKLPVSDRMLRRAADYLAQELVNEETSPDRQAWLLHALSAYWAPSKRSAPSEFEKKAFDNLWASQKRMNAYTRALFALTAFRYGYLDQAHLLATNLENGVVRDDKPDTSVVMEGAQSSDPSVMGTVHWGEDGFWWRWSDSGVETTSFAILALTTIDPQSPLIEPAVNWLLKNRRGAQWTNTRDTAISVLALNQYLKSSGELGSPVEFALTVNGHEVARKKLSQAEVLGAPSRFEVKPEWIRDDNEIRLERTSGSGPLYFSAEARFFSLEEPITPAGHELFVRRKYFKKVGRKTLLKGYVYDTLPLEDNGQVHSGDRIEVVVTVETKNDYEYLLFEDLKPAGFEAVEVKSGQPLTARAVTKASFDRNYGTLAADGSHSAGLGASTDAIDYTGETRSIYQELRDRKVALFADRLKQGVWEMRYELRAEVPGHFHALPVLGQAMYVPEIRGNSAEVRVEVLDRQ